VNDFTTIFSAEFMRRVTSKPFVIGTLLGVVFISILFRLPGWLSSTFEADTNRIVLAGPPALTDPAKKLLDKDYSIAAVVDGVPKVDLAYLTAHGKAIALVALSNVNGHLQIDVYSRDLGTFAGRQLARQLAPLSLSLATKQSPESIAQLLSAPLKTHGVSSKFSTQDAADSAHGVANVLALILYMVIIFNSQTVMASVAEEKTSRIAELLVSAANPSALLAAKIAAVGLTGLIQIAAWIAAGVFTSSQMLGDPAIATGAGANEALSNSAIFSFAVGPVEIAQFFAFFLLGFLEYAALFAAAGSLITRTEDIGTVAVPLIMPIVVGFLLAQFALASPTSSAVIVASFVPLAAPFVMFARIAVSTVPPIQIAIALAINLAALFAMIYVAGKIYKAGMLSFGRTPSLRQVIGALRA